MDLPYDEMTALREEARNGLEDALHEVKRVIVGQDGMLERVVVALLTGGHVLLEGVPGLAKTLTVKTLAEVLGGTFRRVQFTPDLVPADLVGTRIYRPNTGTFDVELGPVFGNFLLADEINRAPAKVQSALLEVMQEHQVTIGGRTFPVPAPFLVMATQNPIEAEGTYPLPEAQVDRFLMKILVDYPSRGEEAAVVGRSLAEPAEVRECLPLEKIDRYAEVARSVFVDRDVIGYAVALADATRRPADYGIPEVGRLVEYGASPRGPIGLVQSARVLALLRGRGHVSIADVRDLAADVLRHRIVPSYDALSRERDPRRRDRARARGRARAVGRPDEPPERCVTQATLSIPAARQGPGSIPAAGCRGARPRGRTAHRGCPARRPPRRGPRRGDRAGSAPPVRAGRRRAPHRPVRHRAHRRAACPRARSRAHSHHLDRARRVAVHGIRHCQPVEVGCRRGRRACRRPAGGAPQRPRRSGDLRRRQATGASTTWVTARDDGDPVRAQRRDRRRRIT